VEDLVSPQFRKLAHDDNVSLSSIAGAVVRNLEACQVLVTALLYPDISAMTLLPPGNKDQDAPPNQFSLTVFATLLSIIRDHPMNYFLLERLNILSYAIERLDTYHPDLQVSHQSSLWKSLLANQFLTQSYILAYSHL
jgi:hypothetical protein